LIEDREYGQRNLVSVGILCDHHVTVRLVVVAVAFRHTIIINCCVASPRATESRGDGLWLRLRPMSPPVPPGQSATMAAVSPFMFLKPGAGGAPHLTCVNVRKGRDWGSREHTAAISTYCCIQISPQPTPPLLHTSG
jgi:hypothetical protein